ncbi:uncharacterized protein ACMZJ9_021555 [Mantella aurantiaca]
MENSEFTKGHKDLYTMMESFSYRNPPEIFPHPLYSRDSTQEDHNYTKNYQGEDVMEIKVECEVEETYVRDDQQYTEEEEEAGMMRTSIEEDTPTEISTGHAMEKPSKDHLTLSLGCKMEDEDITGEKTMISSMDGGDHSVDRSWDPSDQPRTVRDGAVTREKKTFSSLEYEENFTSELSQRGHTAEKTFYCLECGKCFSQKSDLAVHQRSHTGENQNSCPECGKCFSLKAHLNTNWRSRIKEKPYYCPECGKCFTWKSKLVRHLRSHTGEKPYTCSECGKCFRQKSQLVIHQRSHTGEKPYSCSLCKKCFIQKSQLVIHKRSHTGEKPYSCLECGKCFSQTAHLKRHQRFHLS